MQDFEKLSEEEQQEIILSIGNKLTDKERWYWMGLIHLLRTLKEENKHYHTKTIIAEGKQKVLEDRINKAIEYIKKNNLWSSKESNGY